MLYYFTVISCSASSVSGCVSHSTQTVVGLVFRGKRKGIVHSNTHIFFPVSCVATILIILDPRRRQKHLEKRHKEKFK